MKEGSICRGNQKFDEVDFEVRDGPVGSRDKDPVAVRVLD